MGPVSRPATPQGSKILRQTRFPEGGGDAGIEGAGLLAVRSGNVNSQLEGGQSSQPGQQGAIARRSQQPSQSAPQPGVSGVTPGAVERRLGGVPPTQAVGSMGAPSAQFSPPGLSTHKPNQVGPGRGELNAPVGNLENFLRTLQSRNRQER